MRDLTQRFEKTRDVVLRQVAEERVLVPLRRQVPREVLVFLLEGPVARRAWDLLDGAMTGHELVALLQDEFEVERAEAELDVRSFLDQLLTLGALKPAREESSALTGELPAD